MIYTVFKEDDLGENLLTGTYTREISVRHLTNGMYYLTLETPQVRLTSKLSVIK